MGIKGFLQPLLGSEGSDGPQALEGRGQVGEDGTASCGRETTRRGGRGVVVVVGGLLDTATSPPPESVGRAAPASLCLLVDSSRLTSRDVQR